MFSNIKRSINSLTSTTATTLDIAADTMKVLAAKADTVITAYSKSAEVERERYINLKMSEASRDYARSLLDIQKTYQEIEQIKQQLSPEFSKKLEETLKKLKQQQQ